MSKLLVSFLITLLLITSLNAKDEKESKEWNEIKATTKNIIDKGANFSNHVLRDAKKEFNEFNNSGEVKELKKSFSSYYNKISKDTKKLVDDIGNSEGARKLRKKSNEFWKSIFGEKPKR